MICPSSLWHHDSNPQPLEHKSPPKTTRPGLQPSKIICLIFSHISDENLPHGIEKCHIQNKPLKVAKYLKFCQSCGILPNLVTLLATRVS